MCLFRSEKMYDFLQKGYEPRDENDDSKTQVTLASATFPARMNFIFEGVMNVS